MGEAKRKQAAGNIESDPKWKRKISKKKLNKIVTDAILDELNDLVFAYKDNIKKF